MSERFTERQGQYLAFMYYYEKINRRPPAEADIQRYFKVSAPSVHQMVLALEAGGHIDRTPGQARSLRVLVPATQLPFLE
jgi:Mn-dependent DtxR family transcriptional regulator